MTGGAATITEAALSVVEQRRMQADETVLALGSGTGDRFRREVVGLIGDQQPLGDIAPPVVDL